MAKKNMFDSPIFASRIKSAKAKLFPEGAIGYFLGPTLALIANSVLANYFNMYLSNVLGISDWSAFGKAFFTWLPVISVIMVVAGNILVGRLMDRSKTKAGKARPLLLLAIPLSVLALLVLFVFSPFANAQSSAGTQTAAFILLAIGYNLWFAIAYPIYYTSHAALVNLSTRNSKDRSLLATISNATSLASMGLCTMILPFFLKLLFVYQTNPDLLPEGAFAVVNDAGKLEYYTLGEGGAVIYDQVASYNHWKIFVIALMVLTALGALMEFFFTRERITEESFSLGNIEEKKSVSIGQQAKICFKDKFWIIMIVFFFLYQLGGMMKNVSQLYFCQSLFADEFGNYTTANGGFWSGQIAIYGAVPTALGMVVAWPLSNKIGKGRAILFGAILSTIGGAIGFIDPSNPWIVVASFVVKAFGSTPAMYLSLALLADILDHQEAKHGFRTDGLTMTIYGAIMAGMTGIATGIMNGVLVATGYDATNGIVSTEALRGALPWVFIGGETICYALIAILFIFMSVEKFGKEDQETIKERQKAAALAAGEEWIEPEERLRREEEEADRLAEEARIADLKAKCEKKGLNFEEEEAKYQAAQEAKRKAAEEKKAKAEAKKAEAAAKKAKKAEEKPEEKTEEQSEENK